MMPIPQTPFDKAAEEALARYGDIIDLPHQRSQKHAPMLQEKRAVQFAPFAALAGYEEAIKDITEKVNGYTIT